MIRTLPALTLLGIAGALCLLPLSAMHKHAVPKPNISTSLRSELTAQYQKLAHKIGEEYVTRRDKDEEENEDHEATAGEALMLERLLRRLDGKGNIPNNALMAAKQQADAVPYAQWYQGFWSVPMPGRSIQDAGVVGWEWLGPGNIGGRTRSIVFRDANTILIGAASGGIWRSANAGGSWTPINDFLPSLNVSCMTIDPTNSNVIYAGTGEGFNGGTRSKLSFIGGAGIFKSTDGGTTWTQLTNTIGWPYIYRLTHHPTQANTLFAATSSGLFRSTDGGANWATAINASMWDVKIDPANPTRVLAGNPGGVFLSTNNGTAGTWTTLTTGASNLLPSNSGRCEVAFGANGTMWVSMDIDTGTAVDPMGNHIPVRGSVYRSTNVGANWTRRIAFDYLGGQGEYDNVIWASPDDANLVVVGGINLWRSVDGGANFTVISDWTKYHSGGPSAHGDQHIAIAPPNYSSSNRRLYFGNDGGIQTNANIYTAAPTTGWTNLANGLGITQFYGGDAPPGGDRIIGGAQDNDNSVYTPSGGTNAWHQAQTGDGGFCAINPQTSATLYTEYIALQVNKSTDGGNSYFGVNKPNGLTDAGADSMGATHALFIAPFVMDKNSPNTLIAGGESLWRTTNGAANWVSIRGAQNLLSGAGGVSQCSALAIAKTNSNRVWAGYNDGRLSCTNGANVSTWIDRQTTDMPRSFVTDIAVNPKNENEVFVAFGGYATNTLWFTADSGAHWVLRHGAGNAAIPAVQINAITFHPIDTSLVFVGTDIGLFSSDSKGTAWNRAPLYPNTPGNNDGPGTIEISRLFWQDIYLVAATYGRGMWRTLPYNVIYVDKSNVSATENGTRAFPYKTASNAFNLAPNRSLLVIIQGDYTEGFKHVNKWIRVISEQGGKVH